MFAGISTGDVPPDLSGADVWGYPPSYPILSAYPTIYGAAGQCLEYSLVYRFFPITKWNNNVRYMLADRLMFDSWLPADSQSFGKDPNSWHAVKYLSRLFSRKPTA